jgi:hypothetical protein
VDEADTGHPDRADAARDRVLEGGLVHGAFRIDGL